MKNYLRVALFLFVAALMGLTAACGTLDDDIDAGEATPTPPSIPTGVTIEGVGGNAPIVGTIGQPVSLKGFSIILDAAKANPDTDQLEANISIDNSKGTDEVRIPARPFQAFDTNNSALTPVVSCGVKTTIKAGEVGKGTVCWKLNGITKVTGYQIQFNGGLTSAGRRVAWVVP